MLVSEYGHISSGADDVDPAEFSDDYDNNDSDISADCAQIYDCPRPHCMSCSYPIKYRDKQKPDIIIKLSTQVGAIEKLRKKKFELQMLRQQRYHAEELLGKLLHNANSNNNVIANGTDCIFNTGFFTHKKTVIRENNCQQHREDIVKFGFDGIHYKSEIPFCKVNNEDVLKRYKNCSKCLFPSALCLRVSYSTMINRISETIKQRLEQMGSFPASIKNNLVPITSEDILTNKKTTDGRFDNTGFLQQALYCRRVRMLHELVLIFPIDNSGRGRTIRGSLLPSLNYIRKQPKQIAREISISLMFAVHLFLYMSSYLGFPLKFQVAMKPGCFYIRNHQGHIYPLFVTESDSDSNVSSFLNGLELFRWAVESLARGKGAISEDSSVDDILCDLELILNKELWGFETS